ncbi:hypothetical protein [Krasilnikoviella flava]|uniref:Uncharacterized protein n=1 Tax=Krasilnikoviella flava TaxID=526729 RepID=A0A1T5IGW5_9MICO|nr:hypothetical protein [Krasilnikoviella flava]SKC38308.1 hypothetical protein SAMN04324258_0495 [Krasilnikoviella flava]
MTDRTKRVLIVGRSTRALTETVALLRARGYAANATNQFDRVLEDYDARDLDLVLLGGQVPPPQREHLEAALLRRNPEVRLRSGLGGVARLLAAQVEELFGGSAPGVEHDPGTRAVTVTLRGPARVTATALWAVPVPPDPVPHAVVLRDGDLPAGRHPIPVPEQVPAQGAYAAVRVGDRTSVLRLGPPPRPLARSAGAAPLPAPEPVTTRLPWEVAAPTAP